jgi:hypothetical protein
MGKRHQPRVPQQLTVRMFGTDADGQIFTESVTTVDLSQDGAQVAGVKAHLKLDEIVGVTYNQKKGHFKVQWVGKPGTPSAGRVGLRNLSPNKPLWELTLPEVKVDEYRWQSGERRRHFRHKCAISIELHPKEGAVIWGKSGDLSLGGFFLEMAIPLPEGSRVKAGLWLNGAKVWTEGQVVSSTPGFGIGVQFTEVAESDMLTLKRFLNDLPKDYAR